MSKQPPPGNRSLNAVEQPGARRNLSKSATRALDILEYFALVGRPLRAIEIAQAFDFNASSADQLLKTMVDSAYLMFDQHKKLYYPSPRLVNFGSWLAANYFGEDRICRLMKSVHHVTGEIVTLSVRYGASMQIVDIVEPLDRTGAVMKGLRVPIADSVIGTAFLAAHSDREVIRILNQVMIECDDKLSLAGLRSYLKAARDCRIKGFASDIAIAADLWALALPLPRPSHGVAMVLGLAGDAGGLKRRESELASALQAMVQDALVG